MKTKMLFIAMAIILGSVQLAKAQQKNAKVYSYAYAYDNANKIFYISSIISGEVNSDTYVDANDPIIQWRAHFEAKIDNAKLYTLDRALYDNDYDRIDDARTKIIGRYRQNGFKIYYIDDFYYKKVKKNR